MFIERAIYDDAVNALVAHAEAVTIGAGRDEGTTMGPLVSKEQQERVQEYIEIGKGEATLAAQGALPDGSVAGRTATSCRRRSSPTSTTPPASRVRRSSDR